MVLPAAFGEAVLPHGTTCVIADPHEVVNVAGAEGLRSFLDEAAAAPVGIFTAISFERPRHHARHQRRGRVPRRCDAGDSPNAPTWPGWAK